MKLIPLSQSRFAYIFNAKALSEMVADARTKAPLSQQELAEKAGLQLTTIRRIESDQDSVGLLSAIAIAKAANFPLPSCTTGNEVLQFNEELVTDMEKAMTTFDRAFHFSEMSPTNQDKALSARATGLLGLVVENPTGSLLKIAISSQWQTTIEESVKETPPTYPSDLASLLDDLGRKIRNHKDFNSSQFRAQKFFSRPASRWLHIQHGRSENMSSMKLDREFKALDASISKLQIETPSISLYDLSVQVFLNKLMLNQARDKAAKETNCEPHEHHDVFMAEFIRLLQWKAEQARRCGYSSSAFNERLNEILNYSS